MKYLVFTFSCLFPLILLGQSIQKGIVSELNSGNNPIPGVDINAIGSSIASSDDNGYFSIAFLKKDNGEPVMIEHIYKKGYELVNQEDVHDWIFSQKIPFKIVMCKEGFLGESKRKYYNIGEEYYGEKYQKSITELKNQKKLNQISEQQFILSLNEANEQLKKSRENLGYYADKFSRINKDDLNGIDKLAVEFLEQGKIDEAIKVYEDARILDKFLEKLRLRDTASFNIRAITPLLLNQVNLLIQKNRMAERMKADTILHTIAKSDTQNFDLTYRYATFLLQEDKLSISLKWYTIALLAAKSEEQKRQVMDDLNSLYSKLEDPVMIENYKKQIKKLCN